MDYMKAKILVVDDNKELCQMIKDILISEGYRSIRYVLSCEEAEKIIYSEKLDLVILDVNFPKEDGFDFYQRVCEKAELPVIFLSARDKNEDRLKGLGLGADDYITKPFLSKELVLRCGAVLKRTYSGDTSEMVCQIGEKIINMSAGVVMNPKDNGFEEMPLTNKEYQLLKVFIENRGRILTFDFLAEAVWGRNYYGYENTLMVHIRKLREKIEDNPSEPKYLITMKALGYRLNK